jgi:hypothetical protein
MVVGVRRRGKDLLTLNPLLVKTFGTIVSSMIRRINFTSQSVSSFPLMVASTSRMLTHQNNPLFFNHQQRVATLIPTPRGARLLYPSPMALLSINPWKRLLFRSDLWFVRLQPSIPLPLSLFMTVRQKHPPLFPKTEDVVSGDRGLLVPVTEARVEETTAHQTFSRSPVVSPDLPSPLSSAIFPFSLFTSTQVTHFILLIVPFNNQLFSISFSDEQSAFSVRLVRRRFLYKPSQLWETCGGCNVKKKRPHVPVCIDTMKCHSKVLALSNALPGVHGECKMRDTFHLHLDFVLHLLAQCG